MTQSSNYVRFSETHLPHPYFFYCDPERSLKFIFKFLMWDLNYKSFYKLQISLPMNFIFINQSFFSSQFSFSFQLSYLKLQSCNLIHFVLLISRIASVQIIVLHKIPEFKSLFLFLFRINCSKSFSHKKIFWHETHIFFYCKNL